MPYELAFFTTASCLPTCAMQMGFGKNKRLSAPRPKKKKVEAREEAIMAASENENPQENACEDAEVHM